MTTPVSDIDEADLMLIEAAKLDLAYARDMHARGMAAEDNYEAAAIARAYQGLTRSMRQTLAQLDKRKETRVRAAQDAARAAEAARPHRDEWRLSVRHGQVREAVRRVMFQETDEEDRRDELWRRIDERLRFEDLPHDFADPPIDEQVIAICEELGIPRDAAANWRRAPEIDYVLDLDDGPAPEEPG